MKELKKGYDFVGVTFVMATYHRLKEAVALIREHAPDAKIVLGGYGTVLDDDMLLPYGDHICREEGVEFMRRLLGQPPISLPYDHPMIVNPLWLFGKKVSQTGIVFGGLGCPNGCDFCCTSHFFRRKHIRLLPTGRDIYDVIRRYLEIDPKMAILIIDEDFLLNRKRAMEFRQCVQEGGIPLGIFCFASIRALSLYTITEILEMGIDGMWIGYEGTRSGFAKQQGRPVGELFRELRDHGISILASMIVGFPYQTPEIIEEELTGLLNLHPDFGQFMIYGPSPGTPFYDRVMKENLMHPEFAENREHYCRKASGFFAVVKHPTMSAPEIEAQQRRCFDEDFKRLGPSIYRTVETWLLGYLKLKDSPSAYLRAKADCFAKDLRKAYPIYLVGKLFGPTPVARQYIKDLQKRVHTALGPPTLMEKIQAVAAIGAFGWTSLKLKLGLFQHPSVVRNEFWNQSPARPPRSPGAEPVAVGADR